jgi:hypothetical protein
MQTFDIQPSKIVGVIKTAVREAILDGLIPNDFEAGYDRMVVEAAKVGLTPKKLFSDWTNS